MAGKLRKLFTNSEIMDAVERGETFASAADMLTELGRGTISKALVKYWHRGLKEVTRKNGEPYIGTTVLDRKIRNEEVEVRDRSAEDDLALSLTCETEEDNSCILHICDTHAPYSHPDLIPFLRAVKEHYQPTRVVHGGDEVDNHALSFHDSDPNLDSAGKELHEARKVITDLHSLFPEMQICHSNHGSLIYRRALKCGIPTEYLKSYREILFPDGGGEGWSWHEKIRLTLPNGEAVQFQHQCAGDPVNAAAHERCNLVLSHEHSKFHITYSASHAALYFGMHGGCLLDAPSLAFAYGKTALKRAIIGCAVIIDSQPVLVPMLLSKGGRWTGRLGGLS